MDDNERVAIEDAVEAVAEALDRAKLVGINAAAALLYYTVRVGGQKLSAEGLLTAAKEFDGLNNQFDEIVAISPLGSPAASRFN